jgi:hypothetical protein
MLCLKLSPPDSTIVLSNLKDGTVIKLRRGNGDWKLAIEAPPHVNIYRTDRNGVSIKKHTNCPS